MNRFGGKSMWPLKVAGLLGLSNRILSLQTLEASLLYKRMSKRKYYTYYIMKTKSEYSFCRILVEFRVKISQGNLHEGKKTSRIFDIHIVTLNGRKLPTLF